MQGWLWSSSPLCSSYGCPLFLLPIQGWSPSCNLLRSAALHSGILHLKTGQVGIKGTKMIIESNRNETQECRSGFGAPLPSVLPRVTPCFRSPLEAGAHPAISCSPFRNPASKNRAGWHPGNKNDPRIDEGMNGNESQECRAGFGAPLPSVLPTVTPCFHSPLEAGAHPAIYCSSFRNPALENRAGWRQGSKNDRRIDEGMNGNEYRNLE